MDNEQEIETLGLKVLKKINLISIIYFSTFLLHWVTAMLRTKNIPVPVTIDPKDVFGHNPVSNFIYDFLFIFFWLYIFVAIGQIAFVWTMWRNKAKLPKTTYFLLILGLLHFINFFFIDIFCYYDCWFID